MSAGDVTLKWGSATEAGVTITSLSNGALSSMSTAIDLTAATVVDILVQLKSKTAAGTLGASPYVAVYAGGSLDGTNYTLEDVDTLALVGTQRINTSNTEEWSAPMSVARAFGGVLPPHVKLGVQNNTGLALNATADSAELYYALVYSNVAAS